MTQSKTGNFEVQSRHVNFKFITEIILWLYEHFKALKYMQNVVVDNSSDCSIGSPAWIYFWLKVKAIEKPI